tara:strand:+ start:1575 stop:1754 length:180 start_codon:yes stop_codon:yes gene_type:complete
MATNKELESQVQSLKNVVNHLKSTNSNLLDEVVVLKNNYKNLVEDVNSRFKVVHEKLFR